MDEEVAIHLFLFAARQFRNTAAAQARSISFEHFLACLRALSDRLNCPSPLRLKDTAHALRWCARRESERLGDMIE